MQALHLLLLLLCGQDRHPDGCAEFDPLWYGFESPPLPLPSSPLSTRAALLFSLRQVLAKKVTAESLSAGAADDLVCLSRFGVGYDSVDVAARSPHQIASWSAARALLMPQVNPGSLYCCGGST